MLVAPGEKNKRPGRTKIQQITPHQCIMSHIIVHVYIVEAVLYYVAHKKIPAECIAVLAQSNQETHFLPSMLRLGMLLLLTTIHSSTGLHIPTKSTMHLWTLCRSVALDGCLHAIYSISAVHNNFLRCHEQASNRPLHPPAHPLAHVLKNKWLMSIC